MAKKHSSGSPPPERWSRRWFLEKAAAITGGVITAEIGGMVSSRGVRLTEKAIGEIKGTEPASKNLIISFFAYEDEGIFIPSAINTTNLGGGANIIRIKNEGDPTKAGFAAEDAIDAYVRKHGTLENIIIAAHGDDNIITVGAADSSTALAANVLLTRILEVQRGLQFEKNDPDFRITKRIYLLGCNVFKHYEHPAANPSPQYDSAISDMGFSSIAQQMGCEIEGAVSLDRVPVILPFFLGQEAMGLPNVSSNVLFKPDGKIVHKNINLATAIGDTAVVAIVGDGLPTAAGMVAGFKIIDGLKSHRGRFPCTEADGLPSASESSTVSSPDISRRNFLIGKLGGGNSGRG